MVIIAKLPQHTRSFQFFWQAIPNLHHHLLFLFDNKLVIFSVVYPDLEVEHKDEYQIFQPLGVPVETNFSSNVFPLYYLHCKVKKLKVSDNLYNGSPQS